VPNPRREQVAEAFQALTCRLDQLLNSWGFQLDSDYLSSSHCGPYGYGYYVRGTTKIGVSCRDTLDNVFYQHSFITQNACSKETETFVRDHDALMHALGHGEDCWLVAGTRQPDLVVARTGQDRVAAFIHDLSEIAGPILREPTPRFEEIIRQGIRSWTIE
jgi:hypothetical protein